MAMLMEALLFLILMAGFVRLNLLLWLIQPVCSGSLINTGEVVQHFEWQCDFVLKVFQQWDQAIFFYPDSSSAISRKLLAQNSLIAKFGLQFGNYIMVFSAHINKESQSLLSHLIHGADDTHLTSFFLFDISHAYLFCLFNALRSDNPT